MKKEKLEITIESSLMKEINNYCRKRKVRVNTFIANELKKAIVPRKFKDVTKDNDELKMYIEANFPKL